MTIEEGKADAICDEAIEAELTRLAALSAIAYERERPAAAKKLCVRTEILDRIVNDKRRQLAGQGEEREVLQLPTPDPWPEPVNGPNLLENIARGIRAHVVMEACAADAMALWIVHAHALDAFTISPRLAITSAEKRSGKTTVLDILGCLVPRPLPTANATAPAIFRTIEALAPTLLIDEADTFLRRNDELRGVLNSGHRRATARVLRLDGNDYEPRQFGTWAATAIAMIGRLPDTLADRSIEIRLRRRLPNEPITRFRADRASNLATLGRMTTRWAADHSETLRQAEPVTPSVLHDRAADNWMPLLAIADEAGGEWPERARRAAVSMAALDGDAGSIRETLLADIRMIFADVARGAIKLTSLTGIEITDVDRIPSSILARLLCGIEGHPWAEWRGKSLTNHTLARLLRPFGIASATHRFTRKDKAGKLVSATDKGYLQNQFDEAFARYLPPLSPPAEPVTTSQPAENQDIPADPKTSQQA